jgi:hypothetical protein
VLEPGIAYDYLIQVMDIGAVACQMRLFRPPGADPADVDAPPWGSRSRS